MSTQKESQISLDCMKFAGESFIQTIEIDIDTDIKVRRSLNHPTLFQHPTFSWANLT